MPQMLGSHPRDRASDNRRGRAPSQALSSENPPASAIARAESAKPARKEQPGPVSADFNPELVRQSFTQVMSVGPDVTEYFYARLFATSPDARSLFPASMVAQREHVFAVLGQLLASVDNKQSCQETLGQLGRSHRRFGVTDRYYLPFLEALRETAEHFTGAGWTAATARSWQLASEFVAAGMKAAAAADATTSPPWWIAEIVSHELRSPGVAVLRLRPSQPLPYQAGQYVPVQVPRWPRVWRPYSLASKPRPGGLLELHVKAVPGGLVSNTLVHHSNVGDNVLLGSADGAMKLTGSGRDLLCVAGGTGLAPLKAIVEQAIASPLARTRRITLFFGARQQFDLYDLEDLQLLESACPSLRVLPVLSDDPGYSGLSGMLPDVLGGHGLFENVEAYVCGPVPMVSRATAVLSANIPAAQIHHDPLVWPPRYLPKKP